MRSVVSFLPVLLVAAPVLAQVAPPPPPADRGYEQTAPGEGPMPSRGYGGQGHAGRGGGMGRPLTRDRALANVDRGFAQLDADGDGVVTRAEYDAFRQARRAQMMARRQGGGDLGEGDNGGGNGSPTPPGVPGGRGGRVGPLLNNPAWFDMADTNYDGRVTLAEAQRGAAAMFDRMDLDHDGQIAPEERHRAMRGGPAAPPEPTPYQPR